MPERTPKEMVTDKLLLLELLRNHEINSFVKLQKTVFFAEDTMNVKKIKGFSYSFIRWHYGEFSRELEADLNDLIKNHMITQQLSVASAGREILERCKGLLDKNSILLRRIGLFGSYTEHKSLDDVKDVAYTKITRNGVQVKDIGLGTVLLNKLQDSEAEGKFEINDGWAGTLEVLFDRASTESLHKAMAQTANIPFVV